MNKINQILEGLKESKEITHEEWLKTCIKKDNTRKNMWYAVTDKGVLYGGSPEIVMRKIVSKKAKEKTYSDTTSKNILSSEDDLPF